MADKNIKLIINIFKYIYLILGVFSVIVFSLFLPPLLSYGPLVVLPVIIGMIISFAFYWGLKKLQPWVPVTIIILASLSILRTIFSPTQLVIELIAKIIGFCFQIFILYFFTRPQVKAYFKSKVNILV